MFVGWFVSTFLFPHADHPRVPRPAISAGARAAYRQTPPWNPSSTRSHTYFRRAAGYFPRFRPAPAPLPASPCSPSARRSPRRGEKCRTHHFLPQEAARPTLGEVARQGRRGRLNVDPPRTTVSLPAGRSRSLRSSGGQYTPLPAVLHLCRVTVRSTANEHPIANGPTTRRGRTR